MAGNLQGDAAVATDRTCGICLEDSKDPLNLPCGHSFCDGCLDGWRSRYGVKEEMRRKCPICRATIPPSKEMVTTMLTWRAQKQMMEDDNDTSSDEYHRTCEFVKFSEEEVGPDWDGVTVLQDNIHKSAVEMPDYIFRAIGNGDVKGALKWINANRAEDRVNAISSAEGMSLPALIGASMSGHLELMTILLQLGANVNTRGSKGFTAIHVLFSHSVGFLSGNLSSRIKHIKLLLSWGATFFPEAHRLGSSREACISKARKYARHDLANLLESELGGRRCEIGNLSSRPELNGKTCVADEYLPDSNQYKVTLENKTKEVLVLGPENLKRRDRTPQDCGYYIEFKNGRTIRHDFDSSEDCQAFVAALNRDELQPVVTEEAEARAEQAAAELLAELGRDDSSNNAATSGDKAKKTKKKKSKGKKKK